MYMIQNKDRSEERLHIGTSDTKKHPKVAWFAYCWCEGRTRTWQL